MEKGIPCKWNQKKVAVEILISDKIYVKKKNVTRDKEGHYIIIKGLIQEEDITIIHIYTCNTGAPKYMMQILTNTKGKIDSNRIIEG